MLPAANRLRDALGGLIEIGPFFALAMGPRADTAGFRPLGDLYRAPDLLAHHVHDVGVRLGTDEVRVAASIAQLGIAARLWSVALGAVARAGVVPDLDPDRVMWRLSPPGPAELWVDPPPRPAGESDGDEQNLADTVYEVVAEGHLVPLAQAIRRITPVSERLLWGNAASGLAGVVRMLDRHLRPDDPARADTAMRIAGAVQSRGHLRDTGTWSGAGFRRTTCCLYYRIPQGGTCGDCVFTDAPPSRRAPGDGPR
ncbi:hypothetical protein EHYA_05382 [Embleya hyalina]|uniref:Ferric siderophore reductase C-terminal domain-containing protein n=2 Tax=Embleya hyalina TaxID=516124 RepID=A0A401YSY5_9ACTN|nr:hypothetical protein EHYA_05382 [Embleya hyalina]